MWKSLVSKVSEVGLTDIEKLVKQATSKEEKQISFDLLEKIAELARDDSNHTKMLSYIWTRITENKSQLHVLKSLQVLNYLLGDLHNTDAGAALRQDVIAQEKLIRSLARSKGTADELEIAQTAQTLLEKLGVSAEPLDDSASGSLSDFLDAPAALAPKKPAVKKPATVTTTPATGGEAKVATGTTAAKRPAAPKAPSSSPAAAKSFNGRIPDFLSGNGLDEPAPATTAPTVNRQLTASKRATDGSNPFADLISGAQSLVGNGSSGSDGTVSPGGAITATPPRVNRAPTTATPNLAAAGASAANTRALEDALRNARAEIEQLKKDKESLAAETDKANRRAAAAMTSAQAASSAAAAASAITTSSLDQAAFEELRAREANLRREKDQLEISLGEVNDGLTQAQSRVKQLLDQAQKEREDAAKREENLRNEMATLRTQLGRERTAQLEGAESHGSKLEAALADASKQREEVTRLRGDVADGILKQLALEKKIGDVTTQNATLADDLRKAQRKVDDLTRELDEEKKGREQLQVELRDGKDPLHRLTAELDEKRIALDAANHAADDAKHVAEEKTKLFEAARAEQLAATAMASAAVAKERVAVSERDSAIAERDTLLREAGDLKRRIELLTSELDSARTLAEQARNEATEARTEALKITGEAQRAKLEAADSVGGVQAKIKALQEEVAAVTKREEELITLQQMDETRMSELQKQLSTSRQREQATNAQLNEAKKALAEERKRIEEDRAAEDTKRALSAKDDEAKRIAAALALQSAQAELVAVNARVETSNQRVQAITDQARKQVDDIRSQLTDAEAREEGLKVALQLAKDTATQAQTELRRLESGSASTTRELDEIRNREVAYKKAMDEWRTREALLVAQVKEATGRANSLQESVAESAVELSASRQREENERARTTAIENKLAAEVAARRERESEQADREAQLRKTIVEDHSAQASATAKLVQVTNELDNARADVLLAKKTENELRSQLEMVNTALDAGRQREDELDSKGKMVVSEANRRLDLAASQVKELTEQLTLLQTQLNVANKQVEDERATVLRLTQTITRKEKGLEEALDALTQYHEQAHPWLKPKASATPTLGNGINGGPASVSQSFSIPATANLNATSAAASRSFSAGSPSPLASGQPATPKRTVVGSGVPAKVAAKRPLSAAQSSINLTSPTSSAANSLRSPRVGVVAASPRTATTPGSTGGVAAKKRPTSAAGTTAKKSPAKAVTTA